MKLRRLTFTCPTAVVSLALLAFFAMPASAALFVPTTTDDGADGSCDSHCTLREAVVAANAHAGEDVILVHAGNYRLWLPGFDDTAATGDLDLLDDVLLVGDDATRTFVDGGGGDRIFDVASGVAVTVRELTLRNGVAWGGGGGAIRNRGELTVERSVLAGNTGHRSFPAGEPAVGGAIASLDNGELTIRASALLDNQAVTNGGALFVTGETTLANVTVHGNHADQAGGGIYVTAAARARFNNLTIADNVAATQGGGLFAELNPFIGISPLLTNSIVVRNTATAGADCAGDWETGYDVVGDVAGCNGPSAAIRHDTIVGGGPVDFVLDPLQNAGGPTPVRPLRRATQPLDVNSPAIDAGSPVAPGTAGACETTDQRGAPRPFGDRCDSGAYEINVVCIPGGLSLCLLDSPFEARVGWTTSSGASGIGQGVQLTRESGYFWFFNPENIELTVKVLDGCGVNNHYWVFASGMTDVGVRLTIWNHARPGTKEYTNPQGQAFRTILDTTAFRCN